MKKILSPDNLWCGTVLAVYALCFSVNVGYSWWDFPAEGYHLAATAGYTLFWLAFTLTARRSRMRTQVCVGVAGITLLSAVFGLAARNTMWDFLLFPSLVLAPFSSVPLYGLRFFFDWTVLELVSITLSSVWLAGSLIHLKKLPKE